MKLLGSLPMFKKASARPRLRGEWGHHGRVRRMWEVGRGLGVTPQSPAAPGSETDGRLAPLQAAVWGEEREV